jgi:hypothetical protein
LSRDGMTIDGVLIAKWIYWTLATQNFAIYWALIFVKHNNTPINSLTFHCVIIEFIGRTMSLHVSAHGAVFRRYINNLTLLNYCCVWRKLKLNI